MKISMKSSIYSQIQFIFSWLFQSFFKQVKILFINLSQTAQNHVLSLASNIFVHSVSVCIDIIHIRPVEGSAMPLEPILRYKSSIVHRQIIDISSKYHRQIIDISPMDHRYIIDGPSIYHRWIIDISSMDHRFIIDGSQIDHRWDIDGSSMDHRQIIGISSTDQRQIIDRSSIGKFYFVVRRPML